MTSFASITQLKNGMMPHSGSLWFLNFLYSVLISQAISYKYLFTEVNPSKLSKYKILFQWLQLEKDRVYIFEINK